MFGTMLVAGLVSPLLVGCGPANASSQNESSVSGATSSSDASSVSSQDLSGADLTYVNWNLGTADQNNLERQMVAAFNAKYNKNVKIVENINTGAYEDAIVAMAAKDQMPDVFMLTNTTFGLSNQYLADMTSYANADAAWEKSPRRSPMPPSIKTRFTRFLSLSI